jgi:hypothetical protein
VIVYECDGFLLQESTVEVLLEHQVQEVYTHTLEVSTRCSLKQVEEGIYDLLFQPLYN